MLISTGLRNSILTKLALEFESGVTAEIKIYSGAVPATADADVTGLTELGTVQNTGATALTFGSPSAGVLSKTTSDSWTVTPTATGTATFYRLVLDDDDESLSTTLVRIQGTVDIANADMLVDSTTFTESVPRTVSSFSIGMPSS